MSFRHRPRVRFLAVLALAAGGLLPGTAPAAAGCSTRAGGFADGGGYGDGGTASCPGRNGSAGDAARVPARERRGTLWEVSVERTCSAADCRGQDAPCAVGLDLVRSATRFTGPDPGSVAPRASCATADAPAGTPPVPVVTVADVRAIGLPASDVVLEPRTGEALVGLPVNVWTRPVPLVRTIAVLGVPVTVRAVPSRWTWSFGDGSVLGPTTDPGGPWPAMTTTHTYSRSGTYVVGGTTTWTAEYLVPGAAWRTVEGTVDVEGDVGTVTVRAATNLLTR